MVICLKAFEKLQEFHSFSNNLSCCTGRFWGTTVHNYDKTPQGMFGAICKTDENIIYLHQQSPK